jgi:chaperonin GroEL
VLAQSILNRGLKLIEAGHDPMDLKRGMDIAAELVAKNLLDSSIKVDSIEQVRNVAAISANGDSKIGDIIADAMSNVGFDGVITIEDSKTHETYMDLVEGMQFDSGYMSPYFINEMTKFEVNFTNPFVFVYNGKIKGLKGLVNILEYTSTQKRPLLIIADNIEGDALQALILNKVNGTLNVAAVRSPGYGENKKEQLRDIATAVGAHLLSEDEGHDITNINANSLADILGSCETLNITSDKTTIVNGGGDPDSISNRINEMKSQFEYKENESEKLLIKERLAKLEGGVAILKIGAYSEVELKEKKDRLDDALSATRAAIEEGILPGGGVALLRASNSVFSQIDSGEIEFETPDQKYGALSLLEACKSPLSSILANAGISFEVVQNNLEKEEYSFGLDVRKNKYVDMISAGIIDPTKVTRSALENSVSIAGLMITTECTLIEEETDSNKADA